MPDKEQIKNEDIVTWNENFATGFEHLDDQHRELIRLTNQLYRACLTGIDVLDAAFKETMSSMVEFVKYHFSSEIELLMKINYPHYKLHKAQHDALIKDIIAAVGEYSSGKKFTPHNFVRTLKDWVFGHIAYYDKGYATFAADLKAKENEKI